MPDEPTTIRTTLRLFGPEAAHAERGAIEIELPGGARVSDVVGAAERACPALAGRIGHCRVAVNHAFAPPDGAINRGDELALIGLVSGG